MKQLRSFHTLGNAVALYLAVQSYFLVLDPAVLAQAVASDTPPAQSSPVSFAASIAANNIIKKVDPVYPPIARTARIQGTVILNIVVSIQGAVTSVRYVSGPPLLMKAAMDAVKQWRYTPFTLDGKSVQASTSVAVVFSLGIPEAQYQAELENNQRYFHLEDECRKRLRENDGDAAIVTCKGTLDAVQTLPPERQLERVTAWSLYGRALVSVLKMPEALAAYQQALAIANSFLHSDDAELGYAYFHVADVEHFLGHLQDAQLNFDLAVSSLDRARLRKGATDFEINEYSVSLEHILQAYVALLQQTSQTDKSAKMQEKAEAVSKEIRPCPESGDTYCSPYH